MNESLSRMSDGANAVILRRLRIGLPLVLLAVCASALSDFLFLPHIDMAISLAYAAQGAYFLTLLLVCRRAVEPAALWLAIAAVVGLCLMTAVTSVLTRDETTGALLITGITVGAASLLPWGGTVQAVVQATAAILLVTVTSVVDGGLDFGLTHGPGVALLIISSAAILIAHERTRAEAAIRAAHAQLEQRVAERTAELQRAYDALEGEASVRQRAEAEARQHRAALAQAARLSTMGATVAELAHEINQPLGAIANYAQGCVRRLRADANASPILLSAVEEISTQALRAGEIFRRIRDSFDRRSLQERDARDLNDLIRGIVRLMDPEAQQYGVSIACRLADGLPPIPMDSTQIEQVVVNLVRNGIEAMEAEPDGARELSIATAIGGEGRVDVTVSDTGHGLPPELTERAFEHFFTTKPRGLGVGLSISRSIVEAHGGRLWVESLEPRGAVFRFSLPA